MYVYIQCAYINIPNMLHILFSSATLAVFNSSVSKPRRPVHYSNVNYHGTESKLWDCTHHRYYYVTGQPSVTYQNIEIAGVNCQS